MEGEGEHTHALQGPSTNLETVARFLRVRDERDTEEAALVTDTQVRRRVVYRICARVEICTSSVHLSY